MAEKERDILAAPQTDDPLAPLEALYAAKDGIHKATTNAYQMYEKTGDQRDEVERHRQMFREIYLRQFLEQAEEAVDLTIAMATGNVDEESFDRGSFHEFGSDIQGIREYLEPFRALDPTQDYPFPQISFPAVAVMKDGDQEYVAEHFQAFHDPLTRTSWGHRFSPNVELPVLFDPQFYTFSQLGELESRDPGHAQLLKRVYDDAKKEHVHKYATFPDPLIIRTIGVLPVSRSYQTDFIPKIKMTKDGTAWDPYLMHKGVLNNSGDYLVKGNTSTNDRVPLNVHGREAAMRVSRPQRGYLERANTGETIPLAPTERNRIATILFPYTHKEAPPPVYRSTTADTLMYGGGIKGAARSLNIGEASVDTGAIGFFSAQKHKKSPWGDSFLPRFFDRPIILSTRLLTVG